MKKIIVSCILASFVFASCATKAASNAETGKTGAQSPVSNQPVVEGTIPFKDYQTWYRRIGSPNAGKIPLLVLHGGPGGSHSYLTSLDALADTGREIIYYDQIGSGNSIGPEDPDFYSVELFEEELANVIKELGLKEVHVLGQSWGGMLILDYMINKKPPEVKSIVVSSGPASVPLLEEEINRLVSELPDDVKAAINKGMQEGNYEDPDFLAASDVYYSRHVINLDPIPDYVARSLEELSGPVYRIMWGYVEFAIIGKLKNWDVTDRLSEITVPTLLVSGTKDEITPALIEMERDLIPGAEWTLLEGTHSIHNEDPVTYNKVVEEFLSKHD
jgi:proline-specific peptidase